MNSVKKSVLLLHGWPGTSDDYHVVRKLLTSDIQVIAPDLAGFGDAFDKRLPLDKATADSHAENIIKLIESHSLVKPIIAGYDIGSRVAQAVALKAPEKVGALVITPAYAGIGDRVSAAEVQSRFWYQHFHRLELAGDLLDGNRNAIATYLKYILSSWSHRPNIVTGEKFENLIDLPCFGPNRIHSFLWRGLTDLQSFSQMPLCRLCRTADISCH